MKQKEGTARVKYAPVVERIQEMVQGGEEIPTQTAEATPEKTPPQSAQRPQSPTAGGAGVPPGPQTLPSGRVAKPAVIRQAESQIVKAKADGDGATPRRDLLPHERKHDFAAHIERQDRTARQVARILRSGKKEMIEGIARQAAITPVAQMHTVSASARPELGARVEKALGVAHRFGAQQVYAERKRATGRSRNVPVKKAGEGIALAAKGAPPKHDVRFVAEAAISDFNNELAKRARARAIDLAKEGKAGDELAEQVMKDVGEAADGFLDVIGQEAARAALAGGRAEAMQELAPEIERYVRSEVMDRGTIECAEAGGGCEEGDGEEWTDYDEAPQPPFEDCAGDCRGQLIPVFEDEGVVVLE
jgi:hypothetical protein